MSVYCISDIHGRFDEFMYLLNKIEFNKETDTLYVLGDLIDGGCKNVEVIDYCMKNNDCIEVIIGNHDLLMMKFFKENLQYFENGKYNTDNEWIRDRDSRKTLVQLKEVGKSTTIKILDWYEHLKYYIPDVKVNGRTFYLCHSYPYIDTGDIRKDRENSVWVDVYENENPLKKLGISDTVIMIAGHNPTDYYNSPIQNGHHTIFKDTSNQKIMIDCGAKCLFSPLRHTLACLRLDDFEEFYFERN